MPAVVELADENLIVRICCQEVLFWLIHSMILIYADQDLVVVAVSSDYISFPLTQAWVMRDLVKSKANVRYLLKQVTTCKVRTA